MTIQRISLAQPIGTRDGSLNKDSKNVNGYWETTGQTTKQFIKRPGLVLASNIANQEAQGIYFYKDYLYAVLDNVLYKIDPTTYAKTTVGTLTGTVNGIPATVYFTETFNNNYLFLHNQVNAYLINGSTGTFTRITNDIVATTTVTTGGTNYSTGVTVAFSAPPSGTTATGTVQTTGGVVTNISLTNSGTGYVSAPTLTITPAATYQNVAVTNTSGTATLTAASLPGTILVGMTVSGTGIKSGTTVTNVTGTGPYTITISQTTSSAATSVTFLGIPNQTVTNTKATFTLTAATLAGTVYPGMFVTGTGVAANTKVTAVTGSGPYIITLDTATTAAVTTASFFDLGSGATAISSLNFFPTDQLAPGVAFLDSYVFVATVAGRIYNCNVGDPTIWNPLSYLGASAYPDNLAGIVRHLNYIVGFGDWHTQLFYDAATYPGSPLATSPSYDFEIGCANGDSVVTTEQTVVWIGHSKAEGPGVYLIEGVSPIRISDPYIDRILGNSTLDDITAYAFKLNGHMFYVLTVHDLNVTIVYDLNEKAWYQWTTWALGDGINSPAGVYAEQYFRPSYYSRANNKYFVLDDDNGNLYLLSDNYYNDAGAPIYYRCRTPIFDNGTVNRKFYHSVVMVGDKTPAVMQVRYTSDDYNTWSNYRGVDLNKDRPQVHQVGASRRRAWEFFSTDNQPIRLEAAEIDFSLGGLEQGE